MSEPTQITRTEKRKVIQMDQTAKELRALLLITDLSCKLSETLLRNARTVRRIFETGRNCKERGREATRYFISASTENIKNIRKHGFLQARKTETRKSNKKKVLKNNDEERTLHFPSCTPDVQATLREDAHNGSSG